MFPTSSIWIWVISLWSLEQVCKFKSKNTVHQHRAGVKISVNTCFLAPNLHPEAIEEILRLRPCRVFSPMLPGSAWRKWRRPGRLPFRAASWMPPPRVAVPRAACPRSTVKPFQTLRASDPGGSTIWDPKYLRVSKCGKTLRQRTSENGDCRAEKRCEEGNFGQKGAFFSANCEI